MKQADRRADAPLADVEPDGGDELDEEDMAEALEAFMIGDLQAVVAGDLDPEEFHENHSPRNFRTFAEAGVLTSDQGFVFDWAGQRVYVTIQVQPK